MLVAGRKQPGETHGWPDGIGGFVVEWAGGGEIAIDTKYRCSVTSNDKAIPS
jgi:hypothetical protein